VPVTVKVNGTVNSLVHKGSNHVSMATIPDVCKTPSPAGPVPIPYPNISQSATLAKGTTTVKADGMMAAVKGSEFSLSNGDNAGVAGGVKSSTFMKESTWILYSFDVKLDGNNACRLSDKKFQNHENTADLMGTAGVPVPITEAEIALQQMVCDCEAEDKQKPPLKDCKKLGDRKHDCVDKKIVEHNRDNKQPRLGNEAGWTADRPPVMIPFERKKTFRSTRAGTDWPDAVSFDANGDPEQIFEFKFKCKSSKYKGAPPWGRKRDGRSQEDAYKDLTRRWGKDPNQTPPRKLSNTNCPP
jgi:uncharacterized Zn-binding protein involved in type VI secretion